MAMLRFMDDNMDDNRVPADQSQALPSARPITERLNFAITGSGEWSAENLFIFPENVTHPKIMRIRPETEAGFPRIFLKSWR